MQERDQWVLVIKKFNSVYNDYFLSNEAYKAVFTIGDLYEQLYAISRWEKDRNKALKYYQKTIDAHFPELELNAAEKNSDLHQNRFHS